jgi:hypothetical protein
MATYNPITINIPIEIDAGSFATSTTVQGETVTYNKVHLPLIHHTKTGEPTVANLRDTFLFKEGADQTQVAVDISGGAIGSFANGTAVVKALFKAALDGTDLRNEAMTSGAIYADGTARNTSTAPLKFYVDKDTHTTGTSTGSTLKSYLQEYLYDNLSKIIGLAATTGTIDITMSRDGSSASEIIAQALATQLCGSGNSEQGIAAAALRQNIYEQMFTLAPERFTESTLMNRDPAGNITYQKLPFQLNDTMAFLVTFKFPASQISAPVIGNAVRTGTSNVYVSTGDKINVVAGTDSTSTVRPQLSDFPDATVMMRVKLTDGAGVPV